MSGERISNLIIPFLNSLQLGSFFLGRYLLQVISNSNFGGGKEGGTMEEGREGGRKGVRKIDSRAGGIGNWYSICLVSLRPWV
jgi:hypothetical protein